MDNKKNNNQKKMCNNWKKEGKCNNKNCNYLHKTCNCEKDGCGYYHNLSNNLNIFGMLELLKKPCFECKEDKLLVYLNCTHRNICEKCAREAILKDTSCFDCKIHIKEYIA